ncbi:8-amino-7-oxononanoate synthase [Patulibacter brassicae]|jgi:glycine C-acetyltransferase/8-amino-7-oxononanoate synthase|uniref:8-amino-7-oxononanoate synthase n=1 Tax=Patulibacter brassicae TaxID=1705717 RepID=A0ABU4VNU4_9ACTN|nr:8-amino-7-oxononanoate synthase [Patulibacter brassicae]MDX8153522.1 8-amino-7-oxononanoate synthase [Patulibacter brassicae]
MSRPADGDPALRAQLAQLEREGLRRSLRTVEGPVGPRAVVDGRELLLLCTNDYLGLAGDARVRAAAARAAIDHGAGAGSSRLIAGTLRLHRELEDELARFEGTGGAVLFGAGFLANVGVVGALAQRGGIVCSDALNHASIIDGVRLSGAERVVYRHGDWEHLDHELRIRHETARPAPLVVTDGVFSMDGDVAPLPELVEVCRRHGARLVVDEAHATGVLGPGGRGSVAAAGLEGEVDAIVGTLGKALGSSGAYVAAHPDVVAWLVNRARSLIFSTAPGPPAIGAALGALEVLRAEPERTARLRANAALVREELRAAGVRTDVPGIDPGDVDPGVPIVPIVLGAADRAMAVTGELLEAGIYVQAIRPPTVPDGTSRLRLTVSSEHEPDELRDAVRRLATAIDRQAAPA